MDGEKSDKERTYRIQEIVRILYPEIAEEWEKETPKKAKLPTKVTVKKKRAKKK